MVDFGIYQASNDGFSDERGLRYFQFPMESRVQEYDRISTSKHWRKSTKLEFLNPILCRERQTKKAGQRFAIT